MKRVLGIDLGINTIGWALIERNECDESIGIAKIGTRVIPMTADQLNNFNKGVLKSPGAERTAYRNIRRITGRALLRRERLHRVLNILGFLPKHYVSQIDFSINKGKFMPDINPKLAYEQLGGKFHFVFQEAYREMMEEFTTHHPDWLYSGRQLPHDWTLYYLRKKGLYKALRKEEIAWLLLYFTQNRGYRVQREELEPEKIGKLVEYHQLKVIDVLEVQRGDFFRIGAKWYLIKLENGWSFYRSSVFELDWINKVKDFVVTTDVDKHGNPKADKAGVIKRTFRSPIENDWKLIRYEKEKMLSTTGKTVGEYLYEGLLIDPSVSIRGGLLGQIGRSFLYSECSRILNCQKNFHPELSSVDYYIKSVEELYFTNEQHRSMLLNHSDMIHFILDDLIYYQRPVKRNVRNVHHCLLERRVYVDRNTKVKRFIPINAAPRSNPIVQEFRLWEFLCNLHIIEREKEIEGEIMFDIDVTTSLLPNSEDYVALFEWLSMHNEINQQMLLSYPAFNLKGLVQNYRWNYVEERIYQSTRTHCDIIRRVQQMRSIGADWINKEREIALWEIFYSIENQYDILKALRSFAIRNKLDEEQTAEFIAVFTKFPKLEEGYAEYSLKAIKQMLPLLRMGRCWNVSLLNDQTKSRINYLLSKGFDNYIEQRIRQRGLVLDSLQCFSGLPTWLAIYILYNKKADSIEAMKWSSPEEMTYFIKHEYRPRVLRNAVVERIINELMLLVAGLWEEYRQIDEINLQISSELKNPAYIRKRITETKERRQYTLQRMRLILKELSKEHWAGDSIRLNSSSQLELLMIYEDGALGTLKQSDNAFQTIMRVSISGNPSEEQLGIYIKWMDRRYYSPYTGKAISLQELFTGEYQIDHIIPRSKLFDESLNNKVICESNINTFKGNKMASDFMRSHGGMMIEVSNGLVTLLTYEEYVIFIQSYYTINRRKRNKLLLKRYSRRVEYSHTSDHPYISRFILNHLAPIVRDNNEMGANVKRLHVIRPNVIERLRKDWELNDLWNRLVEPRFKRLNEITGSIQFGQWKDINGKYCFQLDVPMENQIAFSKRLIDYRCHAMDAIILASTSNELSQFISNEYTTVSSVFRRELNLQYRRMEQVTKSTIKENREEEKLIWVAREFYKPWKRFNEDIAVHLQKMVTSFKYNHRVLTKSVNYYTKFVNGKKKRVHQDNGQNWAARQSLHRDTKYGVVSLIKRKFVLLKEAIPVWHFIIDKEVKQILAPLINSYGESGYVYIDTHFKAMQYKVGDKDIRRVEIYYYDNNYVASRTKLDTSFGFKKIRTITDSGIRMILERHLNTYTSYKYGKEIEHPELAFSFEGLEKLNRSISLLNNGNAHQPIKKVRICEPLGNKFRLGSKVNKKANMVEAAMGTNIYFAIYVSSTGKRSYVSFPLMTVIERLKKGLLPVNLQNEKGDKLLFWLSPGDMVYVRPMSETRIGILSEHIYKVVSFSGSRLHVVPCNSARPIVDKLEYSVINKLESIKLGEETLVVKEHCSKLLVDRFGNVSFFDGWHNHKLKLD